MFSTASSWGMRYGRVEADLNGGHVHVKNKKRQAPVLIVSGILFLICASIGLQ